MLTNVNAIVKKSRVDIVNEFTASVPVKYDFIKIKTESKTGKVKTVPAVVFTFRDDSTKTFLMRKSIYTDDLSPVYVSDNMSGKMQGIASISTSVLMNTICNIRRNNPNSICSHCFAHATVSRYSSLEKNLAVNTDLLSSVWLPNDLLPVFKTDIVRFESFGDLNNEIQLVNYFMIAHKNPGVNFTLWTKNTWIVRNVVKMLGFRKPDNLHIGKSSQFVNIASPLALDDTDLFDFTFTVYDENYLNERGLDESNFINCGGRNCRACMNCYGATVKNAIVNEKLK